MIDADMEPDDPAQALKELVDKLRTHNITVESGYSDRRDAVVYTFYVKEPEDEGVEFDGH